jgi:nucleotide-binding universal stress UspA family protein
MFTNILWATDGSEHADRALNRAARLAAAEHAHLHVVHIVEQIVGGRVAGQNVFVNEDEIDAKIKEQARRASAEHGIKTTIHMASSGFGNIADRIAEIAADTGADLIVVGTHGHSALGGLVLGSVTQHLLHVVVCPVLAIPRVKAADGEASSQPAVTTVS